VDKSALDALIAERLAVTAPAIREVAQRTEALRAAQSPVPAAGKRKAGR
jgi:hypothetical protein